MNLINSLLGGFFLLVLWVTCLANLFSGNFFGYKNYYGQPVGTLLLLAVLIIITPIVGIMVWKSYKGEYPKRQKGKYKRRYNHDNESDRWPWQ